ncbi:MAG: hypothetical protein WD651_01540 [Acidimicrobiia bacterium]
MTREDEFRRAAEAFLRAAWVVLECQHVVPTSWFHPYIEVGRDYSGPDVAALPEYKSLEDLISASAPRFGDGMPLGERDFPAQYIFSFLQAFVARSARESSLFAPTGHPVEASIDDLVAAVDATSWEVGCCRVVSHLTTVDSNEVEIGGVTISPLGNAAHSTRREVVDVIGSVIKGADTAFGREAPVVYAPPESVLIVRAMAPKPFDVAPVLSSRIERFLLALRLLWAGTCESVFEVQGEIALVRRFTPTLVRFRGAGPSLLSPTTRVRRTVRLGADDGPRIQGLWSAIEAAEQPREGMALTSFAVAVQKFQLSYHAHTWYDQLVDLATALEAALSGRDTTDVLLRLRTRAAALLATDQDPAAAVFADVGTLYSLRSSLVHGGELSEKRLRNLIMRVSTVPPDALLGTATGYVVDRVRDLVRRSLLARICLAADHEESLWPLDAEPGVDAALADDNARTLWRECWRDRLASFDALFAADRPRRAVDAISQEDTY